MAQEPTSGTADTPPAKQPKPKAALTGPKAAVISAFVGAFAAVLPAIITSLATLHSGEDRWIALKNARAEVVPPVGTILAYGGFVSEEVKTKLGDAGWLYCDGQDVSPTKYPELFKALNSGWGEGKTPDAFKLPDLRGLFLRGVSDGSGHDPDASDRTAIQKGGNTQDKVGSLQMDAIQNHAHQLGGFSVQLIFPNPENLLAASAYRHGGNGKEESLGFGGLIDVAGARSASTSMASTGAAPPRTSSETRPRNAAVNWIIRAKP